MKAKTQDTLSRRDVLKTAWVMLGGLAALEVGGLTLTYMQPRLADGEFGGVITAGTITDFPPGSVTHIPSGRFYLTRLPDGGFLAIYQKCTHLGCNVPWDQAQNRFICPCHNSQFTSDGAVLNPPAPRALDLFPVQLVDRQVQVDTSRSISRNDFLPEQVVYP